MKRITLLFIAILMLNVSLAFADTFTVYGNVQFGMSYDEVSSMFGKKYGPVSMLEKAYQEKGIKTIGVRNVNIAGLDGSVATFAFKDDAVYQVLYDLGCIDMSTDGKEMSDTYFSKSESDSYYNSIQKMLSKKYGIPEFTYLKAEKAYALYSYASELNIPFSNCSELINSIEKNILFNYQCDQVNEWLYPLPNGDYVLVDHFQSFTQSGFSDTRYYNNQVLYTYVPSNALSTSNDSNWL